MAAFGLTTYYNFPPESINQATIVRTQNPSTSINVLNVPDEQEEGIGYGIENISLSAIVGQSKAYRLHLLQNKLSQLAILMTKLKTLKPDTPEAVVQVAKAKEIMDSSWTLVNSETDEATTLLFASLDRLVNNDLWKKFDSNSIDQISKIILSYNADDVKQSYLTLQDILIKSGIKYLPSLDES